MNKNEIHSARVLNAPVELVYQAFANPQHLKHWWGPHGFTNTIHTFDLQPGGKWMLTMHGPEKGHYENAAVFDTVTPNQLVSWKRISQPLFDMEIAFEKIDDSTSKIAFRMLFETVEACEKIRKFVEPNNEENFDRLTIELSKMKMN